MSRYQKKHLPTYTYRDHQPSFINFFYLVWSVASSLFNLSVWRSFCTTSVRVLFSARCNIYAMMPVRLSVTFVHCGHRVRWIPDIFAFLDRWISLLLTDNAWPGLSDGLMPGFLVEGDMEKVVIVAISLILLIFYRWTTWPICLYERYWNFFQ